jgi:outer membrane protein OmpA-like peptidoglycan-associated protein
LAALVVSVLLHVLVFLALDELKIALHFSEGELSTAPINVEQVEVIPSVEETAPPADVVVPSSQAAALLEEVDLLSKLPKDQELDIKPDLLAPEYALRMTRPAQEGEPEALATQLASAMDIEMDLPDLGRMETTLAPAAVGQVIVDPGAVPMEDDDLGKFTEEILKRGARGKVRDGALNGITSLDDLIGLPANVVVGKKTMLPSDLLFEFNSAQLRESAKVGLMKLGLLMDRNPNLYCWVEGHTDLIGTDEANRELSRRRAAAVREYLVKSLRMEGDKIITRGKGKEEPLILVGTADEQAPNRRVEIRLRKEPPPPEPEPPAPQAVLVPEPPAPAAPAAPPKAEPVQELPTVPKAEPVPELPTAPKAEPVAE